MGGTGLGSVFPHLEERAADNLLNNYSPPYVDRIWVIWGSDDNLPQRNILFT